MKTLIDWTRQVASKLGYDLLTTIGYAIALDVIISLIILMCYYIFGVMGVILSFIIGEFIVLFIGICLNNLC